MGGGGWNEEIRGTMESHETICTPERRKERKRDAVRGRGRETQEEGEGKERSRDAETYSPGKFVGQRSTGAVQILFVHWPYRQSSSLSQGDPTGLREPLSEVRLRHFTLESPTMPTQSSHRRSHTESSQ
jgi:hypothetical protein